VNSAVRSAERGCVSYQLSRHVRKKAMKKLIASALILAVASLGAAGCAEKSETKSETKISTPGGTTTIKTEKEVKKTGDNPP
jgi:hypothetical protein